MVKCDSAVKVNAILQNKENYSVEREMQQAEVELVLNRRWLWRSQKLY